MTMKDAENLFMDGVEKLDDVLSGMADQLHELADSLSTSDEELAELNYGKTPEEIEEEDRLVTLITSPLTNVLEGITDILNNATEKIMEMTAEQLGGDNQADAASKAFNSIH